MKNKALFVVLAVTVIAIICSTIIFPTVLSNSILGQFLEKYSTPDWSEVKERNIVKNSIPIIILERSKNDCTINAENFEYVIDHQYFTRSEKLAKELHYDKENKTLIIPCDEITEEKSKLHVWYATEEALNHSEKYEYFIKPVENKD